VNGVISTTGNFNVNLTILDYCVMHEQLIYENQTLLLELSAHHDISSPTDVVINWVSPTTSGQWTTVQGVAVKQKSIIFYQIPKNILTPIGDWSFQGDVEKGSLDAPTKIVKIKVLKRV